MKRFIFLTILLIPLQCFSQLDLGKTKTQIKAKYTSTPCEEGPRTIIYCVENGNMIGYVFSNNECESIQFYTAYSSEFKANVELENAISSFAKENNMTPIIKNGMTSFTEGNGIGVTFSVILYNGTNYVRKIFQAY